MKNRELFDKCPIGTVLYGIHYRLYYENRELQAEYVVRKELVKQHIGISYNEVVTSDGSTPFYYSAKEFGRIVFFTAKEAAQECLKRTTDKDKELKRRGEKPMRRTWERYLEEGTE